MHNVRKIENPAADVIGDNIEDFLNYLKGPTAFFIEGKESHRCRAIVTLLHGNEPSGVMAFHRWLRSAEKPTVNLVCIVASVEAALQAPLFSHRVLPGLRDLNRCFRAPFEDSQGKIAEEILQIIKDCQPEAIIDIHNTSGSGPSFGVAVSLDDKHRALVSLFSRRLVTNDLRIGALMEIAEHLYPTVTIECGGRLDEAAHELAWTGLRAFVNQQDIFTQSNDIDKVDVVHNPVRLELSADCRLAYASAPIDDHDLVLLPDIERYNFGTVAAGTRLGWVGEKGRQIFHSSNIERECVVDELISIHDGGLYTAQPLKLFMITNDPEIAKMDCLFYAAKANGQEL